MWLYCLYSIKSAITKTLLQYRMYFKKTIARVFYLIAISFMVAPFSCIAESNQIAKPIIQGNVDILTIEDDKLIAQGWAGAINSNDKVVSISIWFSDTLIYDGKLEQFERQDVAKATGRYDWVNSGWRVSALLPTDLNSGTYPVKVQVKTDNGDSELLKLSIETEQVIFDRKVNQPTCVVTLILIILCILLYTVYFQADFFANWLNHKTSYSAKPPIIFAASLFFSFLILVSMGITGSSLGIGLDQTSFIKSDETNIWQKNQLFRSDEWMVFTPLAIAQYNHQPKFPVVNTNLGEDGQNMLVVGMAGVPVAHVSAIAKPATWGFFLFDLKRALSWYWCFPIFSCLLALWGVVTLLIPGQWRSTFLISLWFSVSPYVSAWSNWPAYTVFFPSLAFISAIAILRSPNKYRQLVWSCILGLSLSGFVLVLYPPWQVSVGYLFFALFIGIIIRDNLYKKFNSFNLLSYVIAIIISSLILWKWWSDASIAIQAMMDTVYPGKRTTLTGGGLELPTFLRGFTNLITLTKLDAAITNSSEMASFCYMLLPLVMLFVLRLYQKSISSVEFSLAVFIGFILYFLLAGIPVEVAELSLWGRVTNLRTDLSFGLSNIILCGLLLLSSSTPIPQKMPIKLSAFILSFIWALVIFESIYHLPESIIYNFSPGLFTGIFFVAVIAGYWLVLGKFREFIYLNLALSVATTLPFNPINIAPHSLTVASFINEFNNKSKQRILVLETQVAAMHLLASGLPVANGIFYYPQSSLWNRLDKDHTESEVYNRYQHLIFTNGIIENKDNYKIETPQLDMVKVIIGLEHFDFRKTGAQLIVAHTYQANMLAKNNTLLFIRSEKGWSWFQIREDLNAS